MEESEESQSSEVYYSDMEESTYSDMEESNLRQHMRFIVCGENPIPRGPESKEERTFLVLQLYPDPSRDHVVLTYDELMENVSAGGVNSELKTLIYGEYSFLRADTWLPCSPEEPEDREERDYIVERTEDIDDDDNTMTCRDYDIKPPASVPNELDVLKHLLLGSRVVVEEDRPCLVTLETEDKDGSKKYKVVPVCKNEESFIVTHEELKESLQRAERNKTVSTKLQYGKYFEHTFAQLYCKLPHYGTITKGPKLHEERTSRQWSWLIKFDSGTLSRMDTKLALALRQRFLDTQRNDVDK